MTTATDNETAKIRQLLATYETSLNTSNAALAVSCYTTDGVFFPTTLPTASGHDALLASYQGIFGTIALAVAFTVNELVVTSATTAYALTGSAGKVTVLAEGGPTLDEANREIFLFSKVSDDEWKIARYMFNKSA